MANAARTQVRAYGVRLLLSRHAEIRRLKRRNTPAVHGHRLWSSSWLLMDYFDRRGLKEGARVMEVGCGWGLAGIYCAKKHKARVTAVDMDPEVFPYVKLHADINHVNIKTVKKAFHQIRSQDLERIDVLIGADICFWDTLVKPLKLLILRSLRRGVKQVLIADPGRPTFETMSDYFVDKGMGDVLNWTARRPRRSRGRILIVRNSS